MTEVPRFTELQFEERAHAYLLNGVAVPSVTTVMKPLSESWYGGLGVDAGTLDRAARRGTAVHNAIENRLAFGIDDIPPEYAGYYSAYKSWESEARPEVYGSESRVYHRALRYAGTVDMACAIGGVAYCVDFKTSSQLIEMLCRVQTEAYCRALASHGFECGRKAIVHLKKDGRWAMEEYAAPDTEAFGVFCGLLSVHNYKSKYGR